MPRKTFQFSIVTIAMLAAIAALSLTVFKLGREHEPLITENRKLHEERGTLAIRDATKVHAIRIPERFARNSGSFRIYVPKGSQYRARAAVNQIPRDGFPSVTRRVTSKADFTARGCGQATLSPGEHVVSLWVDTDGQRPVVRFRDQTIPVHADAWPSQQDHPSAYFESGVYDTTIAISPEQTLTLRRLRLTMDDGLHSWQTGRIPDPDGVLPGLLLWIEPID